GQAIKAGQDLFYVLSERGAFKGEMYVGQQNFGKLKVGQKVIVKLPSYPFQEFGTLRGQVQSISEFSRDSTFMVSVQFPDGLRTSSHRRIQFRNGMLATGEIITDELRILERIFMEFLKLTGR
ncbi:HlyD family efflux transporter periplasmic adaptor subunit, partial [Aphanothece microscopica]|uniref:HlyD family efflux transporter periplasmic adaptor subunit n=1 Tax=Aphanothece microscopica TaxID=1049561 RepID=UPI0039852C02